MRKIAFLILIGFCSTTVSQTRFDFVSGITISSLSEDLIEAYGFDTFREEYILSGGSATSGVKNSVRIGFYLSAEADLFISENTFLKTGLKYSTFGDSYFFKTDDVVLQSSSGSETDEKFKLRPRLDYFSIPVNIGRDVSDKISIYGGITPAFNVNNILRANRFEQDGSDVKVKWDKTDNPIEARSFVPFVNGGISYFANEGGNIQYVFDLKVSYSLSGVYDDPAFSNSAFKFNEAKIFSIDLGMGVSF